MNLFAQILGFIALAFAIYSYFTQDKNKFLLLQIVSNIFYAASFLVLNAFVGGVIIIVSTIRCVYLMFYEKYNLKYKNLTLSLFIICYAIITILCWQSWLDVIPFITSTIFTIAYAMRSMQKMRITFIFPSILLAFYSVMAGTYTGALLNIFEITTLFVAILSYYHSQNTVYVHIMNTSDIEENEKKLFSMLTIKQVEVLNQISHREFYLKKLASSYLINKYTLPTPLLYNNYGKPYKENEFFNVSHSGNYVVFAKFDAEIGVDIEKEREVDEKIINATMNESDKAKIKSNLDYIKAWTLKESLLKCLGTGIQHSKLKNVPAYPIKAREYNGQKFYSTLLAFDGYILSLTTTKQINSKIKIIKEKID